MFVQGHFSRVLLVTLGAFERFFGTGVNLNFLEATGSQVLVRKVPQHFNIVVTSIRVEFTFKGFFRPVRDFVVLVCAFSFKGFPAMLAHECGPLSRRVN